MGKASGFAMRKAKKISGYDFVLGFLTSIGHHQYTFSGWASQISMLGGKCVSRQGLFDRIHGGATAFAKQLLQHALLGQTKRDCPSGLFAAFKKVVLQDSTTLWLPTILAYLFPGNHSRGEQKAVARIQTIIDVKSMRFLDFVLGSFTQNDQSASGSILAHVKKGDLVIRDLGYFAIATFKSLILAQVHLLSRLKYGVGIYDPQGNPLPLKKLLAAGKTVDRWVRIGAEKQLAVRLVMVPLPASAAAEKKRKARQDRDKRLNHGQSYYQWLGYSIYITTVGRDIWTAKQVCRAYRVRWRIEIVFKSWKTGFHMQDMLHEGCGNAHRVMVSIYLMLLFICLLINTIYVYYKDKIERRTNKLVSMLKLAVFVANNIIQLFSMPPGKLMEHIARYCCYEKRNDRVNMTQVYQNL
jgi:Transposase DDE domain